MENDMKCIRNIYPQRECDDAFYVMKKFFLGKGKSKEIFLGIRKLTEIPKLASD